MKKKRTRVPSPFPETARWHVDGEVVGEFRAHRREDIRRLQSIIARTVAPEVLDETMERALRSTLSEKDARHLRWTVEKYSRALRSLWQWMHRLTLEAANPNIKRRAGRALGALYHEAASSRKQEQLCLGNDEFQDQIAPFKGRQGGRRPSPELTHWVDQEMRELKVIWLAALEVAQRGAALQNHRFTRLSFAALSDFKRLWREALYEELRDRWQAQKKARTLPIPGKGSDHSFVKRFGDLKNDRQAGYHLAERFWRRFWEPAREQVLGE